MGWNVHLITGSVVYTAMLLIIHARSWSMINACQALWEVNQIDAVFIWILWVLCSISYLHSSPCNLPYRDVFVTGSGSLSLAYISLTFTGNKGAERVHKRSFQIISAQENKRRRPVQSSLGWEGIPLQSGERSLWRLLGLRGTACLVVGELMGRGCLRKADRGGYRRRWRPS